MSNKNIVIFSVLGVAFWSTLILKVAAQTATVKVSASQPCTNTRIQVRRGESIQFSAIGEASYGYEGSPVNSEPLTNPDGDRFVNGRNIGKKIDPNALLPGAIGALIARVNNSDYFLVGSGNQISMPRNGTLYLCYNDVKDGYASNTGSYTVSIYRR